jgi:hypothetical protein
VSKLAHRETATSAKKLERPRLPRANETIYLDDHPFDLVKYPLPKDILVEEVMIPMRDGIRLAANVFRRKSGPPTPVITTMTPYGKDHTTCGISSRTPRSVRFRVEAGFTSDGSRSRIGALSRGPTPASGCLMVTPWS